jgi:hypothetical protein
MSYGWGYPKKTKVEINDLPPRVIWLSLDFTLANVHRYVAQKYLHILAPPGDENAQVFYEDVFGLSDHSQLP